MNRIIIAMLTVLVLCAASVAGQEVQTSQQIKAQSKVDIEVPGQSVDVKIDPVTKQVTKNVAVPIRKSAPKPKVPVRYVPRTSTVTTGYTGVATTSSQNISATVETNIDAGQIVRIVDGRVEPLERRVGALEGEVDGLNADVVTLTGSINAVNQNANETRARVGQLGERVGRVEADVQAAHGRIDQTNTAVNALSGRVNQHEQIISSYDERIARAEKRDPGKGHRILNSIWNGINTAISGYALYKASNVKSTHTTTTKTKIINPCGGWVYGSSSTTSSRGQRQRPCRQTGGPIRVNNGPGGTGTGTGTGTGDGWGPIIVNTGGGNSGGTGPTRINP